MARETSLSLSRWVAGSRSRHEWSAMTARRSRRREARGAKSGFMERWLVEGGVAARLDGCHVNTVALSEQGVVTHFS